MHPTTLLLLAQTRTQEMELAIERQRLAAERDPERGRSRPGSEGSTPAWRRSLGWALIGAGVRLAGGSIPAGSRHAGAGVAGR